jgi:chromosome segregation ATPase
VTDERELVEALAVANEDRALLRSALADANRERTKAQNEQRETERWLRHLERSRSWKLTRPVRGAGAALRSLSRRFNGEHGRKV